MIKNMPYRTLLRATAAILLTSGGFAGVSGAAAAQDATSAGAGASRGETIVVTARKRDERALDVPFSIQVLGEDDLRKIGAVDFGDYARLVAGLQFEDKGPGRAAIFMRGVSTGGDVDTGKQSTVGLYFDETPISEASSQPDIKLYDIARLEVLRGPQGTLFGSASLSGTLRIIPNAPNPDKVEGFGQIELSDTHSGGFNSAVNAMVNVPLSDKSALRVVGYHLQHEGFLNNGFSGAKNINDDQSYGARAALLVQPTERFDITLSGIYQRSKFDAYYQATDHHPDLIIDQAEPEPFIDRYGLASLKMNYDFGPAVLTSVTSYYHRRRYYQNDIDYFTGYFGVPQAFSPLTYTTKTLSQEFRLASQGDGPISWLVGTYFEDRRETATQTGSPAGEPVPAPADTLFSIDRKTNTRQFAMFGEASYKLTPKVILTAGLRGSLIDGDNTSTNDGLLFGGKTSSSGINRDTPVTPRLNLSYKPSENAQLFLQMSKGFRIGGVNPGLPPCDIAQGCTVNVGKTFSPDSVWNYEAGAKLQLLDQRLSIDASAFYIDWSDIIVNVGRGDGFNGFLNAGAATVKGVELAADMRFNPNFRAGGQFTYTKGHLRSLAPGVAEMGVAQVGDGLPQVPRVSTSAYAEVGAAVGAEGWVYLRGDVQYVDDRMGSFTSRNPTILPNYTLFNLRAGLEQGPYSIAIFIKNLTDTRAVLDNQAYSGVHNGDPYSWKRLNVNVPRTIGVSVSRRF